MFKTNSRIGKEASGLYAEHTAVAKSIERSKDYIISSEAMQRSMGESALKNGALEGVSDYNGSMELDRAFVKRDITIAEGQLEANNIKASTFVENNPRIYKVAVKDALSNNIDLKLK